MGEIYGLKYVESNQVYDKTTLSAFARGPFFFSIVLLRCQRIKPKFAFDTASFSVYHGYFTIKLKHKSTCYTFVSEVTKYCSIKTKLASHVCMTTIIL